jgi:hypothetical protein
VQGENTFSFIVFALCPVPCALSLEFFPLGPDS